MTRLLRIFLLTLAVLLVPVAGWGQKRIYTRSYMIQDFKSKTTKVVLDKSIPFSQALRQEITTLWTVSPYEFCTKEDYEKQKKNPDCYYLHPEANKGIYYLVLSRGGNENDDSAVKRPVEVGSMPIEGLQDNSGKGSVYMPAYISLIQDFVEGAITSEAKAYRGVASLKKRMPSDTDVYTDPEEAREAFQYQYENAAVQVIITPDGKLTSKPRYKLVLGTLNYELFSYAKN